MIAGDGMIRERDKEILWAFLDRESKTYHWPHTGNKGRLAFVSRLYRSILSTPRVKPVEYVEIVSLADCGLMESKLVLSTFPYTHNHLSVTFVLPTSPSGVMNVNFPNVLEGDTDDL